MTDVPKYPDALQPPEASATVHRKDVVDKIGYWKEPAEVQAIPRVDFFRRAQFSNHTFTLVPYLTTIKFSRDDAGYGGASLQEKYMGKIRTDEEFVEKELATLLVNATHKLGGPISLQQMRWQFSNTIRYIMIKKHIDPGRLIFWKQRGQRIKQWRKSLGLDAD